ncbi:uncharacterized protein BDZ99DRAFT_75594 [Mytilinidion resinicola]|uniref:Uncharacterized protein n=1 Tax=Mytilinidion resinicola TaxID=574789 RepID=A0A6A6YH01_9PEZI|nr:uncharacterized protein BDZ99DRAFT_75594 [Mytilinidion resinicola]KAF2807177.1 hypothetical protein BDZ99DRAFT_75594 [Mytilinidion resinicola]
MQQQTLCCGLRPSLTPARLFSRLASGVPNAPYPPFATGKKSVGAMRGALGIDEGGHESYTYSISQPTASSQLSPLIPGLLDSIATGAAQFRTPASFSSTRSPQCQHSRTPHMSCTQRPQSRPCSPIRARARPRLQSNCLLGSCRKCIRRDHISMYCVCSLICSVRAGLLSLLAKRLRSATDCCF